METCFYSARISSGQYTSNAIERLEQGLGDAVNSDIVGQHTQNGLLKIKSNVSKSKNQAAIDSYEYEPTWTISYPAHCMYISVPVKKSSNGGTQDTPVGGSSY